MLTHMGDLGLLLLLMHTLDYPINEATKGESS
jgi:hypothetical protein